MASPTSKPTAAQAVALLYRRFPGPEWLPVHEVPLNGETGDGHYQGRAADFIALRLWGGALQGHMKGFEVKVSRSDFLAELKDPDKRRPLERACTACYIVAPKSVMVSMDELPAGWGWLEMRARDLILRKEAKHEKRPYDHALVFTLLKRFHDIGWYNKARRPMLVDFPKALWTHLGQEVTPAQLREAARELFASEIRAIHAKAREEERGIAINHARSNIQDAAPFLDAIHRATGLTGWSIRTPEALEEALRRGFSNHADSAIRLAEDAITRMEREGDGLRLASKGLKARLAGLAPAAPPQPPAEEAS